MPLFSMQTGLWLLRCEMHYITEKSYIRGVNRMLIKFNKIINGNSADVKKSSAEVNLADDLW